jgi:cytoskeletal protein RodZ
MLFRRKAHSERRKELDMNAQRNIKELDMNAQRNTKIGRSLFSPIALSLAVWIIGGLVLIGMPVQAATPVQSATTTQTATPDQAATTTQAVTPAPVATVDSSLSIPVSGTVVAADGTRIAVSGVVVVNCSAVTEAAGVAPFVVLDFDCSNVTASSGTGTAKKTYDTKGYQVSKIRDLLATDVIVMTAPAIQSGTTILSASSWQVTVTLNYNVTTKKLTSGSITAGNNTFTSTV